MSLKGTWTPILIEKLNVIASEIWATWCYNIELDSFEPNAAPNELTAIFNGNGRWAFNSNLEALGRWTLEETKTESEFALVYNDLIKGMLENDLSIEVDYSDEEAGCGALYRETGVLSSNGETLVYTVSSEENFEHNWTNYMDVMGDTDGFDELVESLCTALGIENDEDDLIASWAEANTYPHCFGFYELDEETQTNFRRLFAVKAGNKKGEKV